MRVAAEARGMTLEQYKQQQLPNRMPNVDSGEAATSESIQAADRRNSGEGGVNLTERRSAAFQKHFVNRVGGGKGTDRRPGARRDEVQVNMDRDSRRYPDRSAAG
jgi:hypothetical protein